MTTERNTRCIACREPIQADATVCPHCRSSQRKDPRKSISDALKWVGGIVTVISMVIGAITLRGYYADWRQRNAAAAELVAASDWLARTRRYAEAWDAYEQALELAPAATEARRGRFELAQRWLRDFSASKDEVEERLADISAVLYRGLVNVDDNRVATILAHIALAQTLRYENGFSIPAPEEILNEALAASARNPYANAIYANWVLIRPGAPLTTTEVREQERRFEIAIEDRGARDWVRDVQFSALVKNSHGSDSEYQRALLAALLRACASMKRNGEGRPELRYRIDLFNSYGFMARGTNVESSMSALPPTEHLALLEWLVEDIGDDAFESHPLTEVQLRYVRVRLLEELGDKGEALAGYRELLINENARLGLNDLVDLAIERLTGELPARALARTYINDPINNLDPWSFHLDTLRNVDPKWLTDNYVQARDFFLAAVEECHERLSELTETLVVALPRVREVVRQGEELERINGFHGMFSIGNYRIVTENFIDLSVIQALALLETGKPDHAIATLNDSQLVFENREGDWQAKQALVSFARARAHAHRAHAQGDEVDADLALDYLLASAQRVVDIGFTDWEQIKSADFAALAERPEYRELILGR